MCKEIELARQYAKRGHSLSFAAQLLGLDHHKLRSLIEGAGIEFVKGSQSTACRLAAERRSKLQTGRSRPNLPPACFDGLRRGREEIQRRNMHTAFGVTGTLGELRERFGCELTRRALLKRLKKGMTIEEALTKPSGAMQRGVVPPQFAAQLEKNRRIAAAGRNDAIQRRLTPSMLQFRAPEHDVVITGRRDARITVEVRTNAGAVLHRLRFAAAFDSGVLFAFNPSERGRLDFIAFEPDSPALISNN